VNGANSASIEIIFSLSCRQPHSVISSACETPVSLEPMHSPMAVGWHPCGPRIFLAGDGCRSDGHPERTSAPASRRLDAEKPPAPAARSAVGLAAAHDTSPPRPSRRRSRCRPSVTRATGFDEPGVHPGTAAATNRYIYGNDNPLSNNAPAATSAVEPRFSGRLAGKRPVHPDAVGKVEVSIPRDRDATFEPRIVKKRQRRLTDPGFCAAVQRAQRFSRRVGSP
jgi:mutator family transposase